MTEFKENHRHHSQPKIHTKVVCLISYSSKEIRNFEIKSKLHKNNPLKSSKNQIKIGRIPPPMLLKKGKTSVHSMLNNYVFLYIFGLLAANMSIGTKTRE